MCLLALAVHTVHSWEIYMDSILAADDGDTVGGEAVYLAIFSNSLTNIRFCKTYKSMTRH